jgi:hypothetical protein
MPQGEKISYVEFPSRDLEARKPFFGQAFGWVLEDYGPTASHFRPRTGWWLLQVRVGGSHGPKGSNRDVEEADCRCCSGLCRPLRDVVGGLEPVR